MFSKRSIRRDFLVRLIFASASLIFLFSSLLYFYIENSILNEKYDELSRYAKNIAHNDYIYGSELPTPEIYTGVTVEVVQLKNPQESSTLYETTKNQKTTLTIIHPFNIETASYLKVSRDITQTRKLLDKILNYIFIINIVGFLLVIVYAILISSMLVHPLKLLSKRLSNMNEHLMGPIKTEELPEEFEPLGETINHLIARIQNFVKYQKELFIGTAHELKTPLAVIKLKNQVTLIKNRSPQEYIEAINITNKTVDEMNIIVSNVLKIGRQEGVQLEKPQEIDVIDFLRNKANDFLLLAEHEGKRLEFKFEPDGFMAILQVGLLNQIIQNFLQNALKFTAENGVVLVKSSQNNYGLLIEVIDEGIGVDESEDLFAPFKRIGDKSGVGLGLFLAKSAADALGAKINIKNRTDGKNGAVACLNLNSKLSCILPTAL